MAARRIVSCLLRRRGIPLVASSPYMTWSRLQYQPSISRISEKRFSSSVPKLQKDTVTIIFIDRDGDKIEAAAEIGDNLLDVAQKNDVELEVKVTFLLRDGSRRTVDAKVGDNLLDLIIEHDVDIDGFGACEGTLACSTCHLIFKQEDYDKLPSKPTDEELDMLDLAFGLEDTSRLGCQIVVTKDLDGVEVQVPQGVADARSGPL